MPPGFYRVFVQQGEKLAWTDVYFAGDWRNLTEGSPELALYLYMLSCVGYY
jgi:hypothetical protein